MKCPECGGTGFVLNKELSVSVFCDKCHGKGEIGLDTVEEIRRDDSEIMTVENLSDILRDLCKRGLGGCQCGFDDGACMIRTVCVNKKVGQVMFLEF